MFGQHAGFVRAVGDAQLVGEQRGGDVLERIQGLEVGRDPIRHALDVTGDVAALDGKCAAIPRDGADRTADFRFRQARHVRLPHKHLLRTVLTQSG